MKRRYKDEIVAQVLALLKINDLNIEKTARATKVSVPTIRKWATEAGIIREGREVRREIEVVVAANETVVDEKIAMAKRLYKIKNDILNRIEKSLPACRHIKTLTEALSIVVDVEKSNNESGDVASVLSHTENFIQVINQQIEINEKINNGAGGYNPQPPGPEGS